MKRFRVNKPYGSYRRGDIVTPEGLWRDHLIMYDFIDKTPIIDEPAPAPAPEPEPVAVIDDIEDDEPDVLIEPEAAVLPEPETATEPQARRKKRRYGN